MGYRHYFADFYYEDRVKSVTTGTGTGSLTLSAATGPWNATGYCERQWP